MLLMRSHIADKAFVESRRKTMAFFPSLSSFVHFKRGISTQGSP